MSATSKSTAKTNTQNAIELLEADHRAVKALFEEFEELKDDADAGTDKAELVRRICAELTVHATIEEEIFYPALREAVDDEDMIDEAEVEHASAKDLIAQLEAANPGDAQYDAKVKVLAELIDHHVDEEEDEMFVQAKEVLDVDTVGVAMAARKAELSAGIADVVSGQVVRGKASSSARAGVKR